MGGKRARERELICFCIASLIFILYGCSIPFKEKAKVEVPKEELQGPQEEHLTRAKILLQQKDFDGSLRENQKILSLSDSKSPKDEAIFNMGLIYAHSENPKKDYGKSLVFFKKLLKEYPQSLLVEQAKIWAGILQENEKLNQALEKSHQALEKLNQMIEKSKQVDIEVEEKKREKLKKEVP
jgi:tetratricopeptide (TPR) repeat protein